MLESRSRGRHQLKKKVTKRYSFHIYIRYVLSCGVLHTVDVQSHPPLVDGAEAYAREKQEADAPRLPATVGFLFESSAERKIERGGICLLYSLEE